MAASCLLLSCEARSWAHKDGGKILFELVELLKALDGLVQNFIPFAEGEPGKVLCQSFVLVTVKGTKEREREKKVKNEAYYLLFYVVYLAGIAVTPTSFVNHRQNW